MVICGYIDGMTNIDIETTTYFAIRMATGTKVHLKASNSSQTECSTWIGNTRQYKTNETVITCKKCWKQANAMRSRSEFITSLGFTNQETEK